MSHQTQNACRYHMLVGTKQAEEEGPLFPEKLKGVRLAICYSQLSDTCHHFTSRVHLPTLSENAVLWRKKYIHVLQVYFKIQRCSSLDSLQRQNDFTCAQGEFNFNFPHGILHDALIKKLL